MKKRVKTTPAEDLGQDVCRVKERNRNTNHFHISQVF